MALLLIGCGNPSFQGPPNVLFIAVDDLRPELNVYGAGYIHSPNIDRLAEEGIIFERAYCNVPVCGASRASLLTGIKPTRQRFVKYNTWAEKDVPGAVSLPGYFKSHGYYTISNGKVFHHKNDMLQSWSEPPWRPSGSKAGGRGYITPENIAAAKQNKGRGWPWENTEAPDTAYTDGLIAKKTIEDLKRLKSMGKPFFLAAGFMKPHLPFIAPKKYWDIYPPETIRLPDDYFIPENAPKAAMHNFGELRGYYGVPKEGPVPDSMALKLIRGYYACVSYVDTQIGKVLDALDELGLKENTIVVLWGDHGWLLGDHTLWCKHSNFNAALRAPLIVRAPGFKGGTRSNSLVEFIDIFPSLCELVGFELPEQLQGMSFVPLMRQPESEIKDVVYSRFINGESVTTGRYLYTEWYNNEGEIYGRMLYDHRVDSMENRNISELPENKQLVDRLSRLLRGEISAAYDVDFEKSKMN